MRHLIFTLAAFMAATLWTGKALGEDTDVAGAGSCYNLRIERIYETAALPKVENKELRLSVAGQALPQMDVCAFDANGLVQYGELLASTVQ